MKAFVPRPLSKVSLLTVFLSPFLLILTACSGGSTSSGGTTTTPTPAPAAASTIYLADGNSNVVYIVPTSSTGAATPTATLTTQTGVGLYSVATDNTGQIYVGNSADQVVVYPAGSTGSATPTRSLSVPHTPSKMYIDSAGTLYVSAYSSIAIYANGATGATPPIRTINTPNIELITDLTTDSNGNVYLAGEGFTSGGNNTNYIDVYSPTASGTDAPTRIINYPYLMTGILADAAGDVFANAAQPNATGLIEFAPTASGVATPSTIVTLNYSIPFTSFTGGMRRDAAGNFYLLSTTADGAGNYIVYGFAPNITTTSTPFLNLTIAGKSVPGVALSSIAIK